MSLLAEKTVAPASRPAPSTGRLEPLNLARQPFTNTRPVTRTAILLWLLGFLLLLGNVSLFWSYLSGSGAKRAELVRMERQVEKESRSVSQLEARLASTDLEQQNKKVRYLNRRIAERTFSWSLLFDRLSEVMPNDIRITRLTPQGVAEQSAREDVAAVRPRDDRVSLSMSGVARSDEALLRFVDNLFAHPAFEEPDLSHESREENDLVKFEVQVRYLPSGTPQPAIVLEELAPPGPATPPPAARPAAPASEIE
jgi:Tfp pilus assembly protein PilN